MLIEFLFDSSALRLHMESQHKKTKIFCENCRKVFYDVDKLELHKIKCMDKRSFECHLCSFKLDQVKMRTMKCHMRNLHTNKTRFGCTICTKKFASKTALIKHSVQLHPETIPFGCSICTRKFLVKETFERHERRCRKKPRYECYLCQYTNPSMSFKNLESHMRKHTGKLIKTVIGEI